MTAHVRIGPFRAMLLVAGNMVGSGVYLLPQDLARTGSSSIVGWIASSAGAFLLAFVFAMLFRLRPASVGMVQQVRDGLGPFFGFQTSLLFWIAGWVGNIAIAVTATSYLGFFFPVLRESFFSLYPAFAQSLEGAPLHGFLANLGPDDLCSIAFIWGLTALNLFGARRVTEFKGLSLALGLIPVFAVALLGWFAFNPETFVASWNVTAKSDAAAISATLVPILWAYLGLEAAAVAAAVVQDPERDVPIATLGGVTLAALIYMAAGAAMFGLMPAAELAASGAPYADVAARWLGPAAAAIVAGCAVLKASGTLCGWMLTTAEASRSGADAGVFPSFFRESAERPPAKNLVICAALMTLSLLASAAPTIGEQFAILISVATIVFLLLYVYCCASLLRATKDWRVHATAYAAAAFGLYAIAASKPVELIYAAALVLITLPLYAMMRKSMSAATA